MRKVRNKYEKRLASWWRASWESVILCTRALYSLASLCQVLEICSLSLLDEFLRDKEHWGRSGAQEVKWSESHSVLSDSLRPMDYTVQARILEWVAFPFSRISSQPRDQTQISCIAGGFFTSWATGKPKNTGVGSLVENHRNKTSDWDEDFLEAWCILSTALYSSDPEWHNCVPGRVLGDSRPALSDEAFSEGGDRCWPPHVDIECWKSIELSNSSFRFVLL